jgi:hypothetical protein
MTAQTFDTGWTRLLERIRKLFEAPTGKSSAGEPRPQHAVTAKVDMRGVMGPRRGKSR